MRSFAEFPDSQYETHVIANQCRSTGVAIRFPSLPLEGWCSAQRIRSTMIAGGNHTIIFRWLGEPDEVAIRKCLIRDCRGQCHHRPKMKNCVRIPTRKEYFDFDPSGGNVLVPARTLIRSRLKGRCRKAAPLRIPRPSAGTARNISGCYWWFYR